MFYVNWHLAISALILLTALIATCKSIIYNVINIARIKAYMENPPEAKTLHIEFSYFIAVVSWTALAVIQGWIH